MGKHMFTLLSDQHRVKTLAHLRVLRYGTPLLPGVCQQKHPPTHCYHTPFITPFTACLGYGRKTSNHLLLSHPIISPPHLLRVWQQNSFAITTRGIVVNKKQRNGGKSAHQLGGKRVRSAPVVPSSVIVFFCSPSSSCRCACVVCMSVGGRLPSAVQLL